MRSYYLSMKPIKGFASYPDSLYNSISGKQVYVCMNSVISNIPVKLQSTSVVAFRVLSGFLMFFVLIVYIVIPFHFFRFIGLIRKNIFFESENIRLLRCLGIELCFIYIGILLYSCCLLYPGKKLETESNFFILERRQIKKSMT